MRNVFGPVDLLPARAGGDPQRADAGPFGDAAHNRVVIGVDPLVLADHRVQRVCIGGAATRQDQPERPVGRLMPDQMLADRDHPLAIDAEPSLLLRWRGCTEEALAAQEADEAADVRTVASALADPADERPWRGGTLPEPAPIRPLPVGAVLKRLGPSGVDLRGESYGLLIDQIGEVLKLADDGREENPVNLDPRMAKLAGGVHRLDSQLMVVLDVDRVLTRRSGVVLYADASHPSPTRATRRSPAADPQLPTQIGIASSSSSARRTVSAASKRDQRSSNGTPTAA